MTPNNNVYYRGKAFSEIMNLILLSIVFGIASHFMGFPNKLVVSFHFIMTCLVWFKIYYYTTKVDSSKKALYILPGALSIFLSLPDNYYALTDPLKVVALLIEYPWLALVKTGVGIVNLIVFIIGYYSLKSTMKLNNIQVGFFGPNKDQVEKFKV